MNKTTILTATLASAVLSGCATQAVNDTQFFQAKDLNDKVNSGLLVQKTDTFFVINDSSSSMSDIYQGKGFANQADATKFSVSKALLDRMNQTLPDVTLASGLRSFGFGPCTSWSFTELNQPVQSYSSASFDSAINSLECSSGGTPVASAFRAAKTDLANVSDRIALILFSDGHNYDSSPVPALQDLKARHGDKLCVYTIWVGNDKDRQGLNVLHQLANIGQCGFATSADAIASSNGMASFVENVFFKGGTPIPTVQDSDGDGVIDSKDKCPNTPKGAIVNKDGCWAFTGVLFDHDSSKIKSKYDPLFSNALKVLKLNPGLTVEIQGHTDSIGSEAYNQKLSERRAKAVKQELVNQGVDGSRLTTVGFGESRPVASNHTAEGRAQNRRVVYRRTDR
ncbi:OmpA family protein [Methylomarinum sp. Ch1-1]|uniref:OmpA family protein n=1 Tax=Methylomarinum roseum TaxID=3067653 RepID=A0AAU7NTM1_9GAMM|nr:OmpA family protein [Methylomarinum sp. Ch1-1]MDP4519653.1 OmpA family protein [Methylomarinum sp. Ch1-1]